VVSAPLLIPLVLIHGLINPHYEPSNIAATIPFRPEGVEFAISIYSAISIFLAVAVSWLQVKSDEFFEWLVAHRFPILAVGLVSQSIAMVKLVEKRGKAVYQAQTARGIPTGPSLFYRVRALPSVILPVITSLINEAEHRSIALWSRGFLQFPFRGVSPPAASISELIWAGAPFLPTVGVSFL
jgi:energy-coupling factor transporter transmembrane protein EcfT